MKKNYEGRALPPDTMDCTRECPVVYALDILGGKWKLPILWHLFDGDKVRYNELKRSVTGINTMMLSKCLKELEDCGLILRYQYNEIPPRVEYTLTVRGKMLHPALRELFIWGETQFTTMDEE